MNQADRQKLQQFLGDVRAVKAEVTDCFSTDYMSDAKSAVYDLNSRLGKLGLTDPGLAADLAPLVEACWDGITSLGQTYERASKAMERLGILDRHLVKLIETAPRSGS